MKLVFSSHNDHKLKEIQSLLPAGYTVQNLNSFDITEEVEETSDTIEGNAILKARYAFEWLECPAFADDTGLEVKALNNDPGVYSARYAGPQKDATDNMELLLKNLAPFPDKTAQFKTVICFIDQAGSEHLFTGIAGGKIISEKRGNQGFGYDPIFVPDGFEKTFAELSMTEKNKISHRARAFNQFLDFLKNQKS